jgi:uncharacterized membrane protein YfcA
MITASIFYLALLGILAGSLSGLLGIGGGVILVPALMFVFGLSEHFAQGTTVALMVPPIGLLATWTYYKRGHVDLRIAALVCCGLTVGGYFGAELAFALSNTALERIFGITLMLTAIKMLITKEDHVSEPSNNRFTQTKINLVSALLLIALGLLVGCGAGLVGIGGGVLLVPALVFLFGLSQHDAQGTTLALMVPPIGLPAAWEYYQHGTIDPTIAAAICAGFFIGALVGGQIRHSLV